jgi:hypothetical protein
MADHGSALYRRSLYTYWKRIQPPPSMVIFDAASRNLCTVKRQSTNTPMQALVLLNDPQFVEASRALAQRMIAHGHGSAKERITYAFRWVVSRKPDDDELHILENLLLSELAEFQKHPDRAEAFLQIGEFQAEDKWNKVDLAAYGVVANAIFNLSESLQKN